jgi:capsular exopolysaccharide synthesis family protein
MSQKPTYTTRSGQIEAEQASASYLNTLYPEALLEPNQGLNIREFWHVIVRNRNILGLITLLALFTALIISLLMKPVYRASTTIQIERPSTAVVDVVLDPSTRRNEKDFWQTQIQLLQSRTLASNVITKLGIKALFTSPPKFLASLRSDPPTAEATFLKGLSIEPLNNSQLIMIHYESGDKELAARIVNSIAETYIQSGLERQLNTATSTQTFLEKQKELIKQRLRESEAALDKYAHEHKIVELDDSFTTETHHLEKIAYAVAEAEKISVDFEVQLKQFASSNNLELPQVKTLAQKLRQLETHYQQKKERYGVDSKSAKKINVKIERIRGEISIKLEAYQAVIQGRYDKAKQHEDNLRERLTTLQNRSIDQQGKTHTYQALKKEVISNQASYQNLLDRIKDVSVVGGLDTNNISIVDSAVIPHKKFKPNLKTNLMLGTLMGFLFGLAFIFLREFMDDSIKSTEELEKLTQLPMFGVIPELKGRDNSVIAQQLITEPSSHIAEAIRSLRTSLSFSTAEGAPKILCLTSSVAGEGKTSIATNLAISYALAGENVLLIDADLRNPTVDRLLKLDNRVGLSNLLSGQNNQQEVILNTSVTNLHVLNSGPLPIDPVELLSSNMMKQLLEKCADRYDRILIDSPPVLGLADALILSNLADATLLVIHAEATGKEAIRTSLKRLRQTHGYVLGTLMNQVSEMGASYAYRYYGTKKNPITPLHNDQQKTPQAESEANIFKGRIS